MSKILPILFNTDMVRDILDGRKTVTRRAIKGLPEDAVFKGQLIGSTYREDEKNIGKIGFKTKKPTENDECIFVKSPCLPGDILYVRETWAELKHADGSHKRYVYRATDTYPFRESGYIVRFRWSPSLHMPKAAARIWLKVTDVRVERLKDITPEQILKEGVSQEAINSYIRQMPEETGEWVKAAYLFKFSRLWDSTVNKKLISSYGWDANPWVWVIEFERCERPKEEIKC